MNAIVICDYRSQIFELRHISKDLLAILYQGPVVQKEVAQSA
jgi:hypothetical protein